MPQRPEFDLNSQTIAPVYGRVGVLESESSKVSILGAYYDRDQRYSGLYVITPKEIKYFDLKPEDLYTVGLTGFTEFVSDNVNYLIRELDEEDGLWMSTFKTELPVQILQQMIIARSRGILEDIVGIQIPENLPEFEAMYVYYKSGEDRVSAIIYMSSYGVYSRNDADWREVNLRLPELQDLTTEDVDPNKANTLVNLYDDNLGVMSVESATKYTVKVKG